MSWWQIALVIYFIPFPFPQIFTWVWIKILIEDYYRARSGD